MMFAACDLGGTNTRTALVDEAGRILSQASQPTVLTSADALIENVSDQIASIAKEGGPGIEGLDGVAVAVAGTVDTTSGTVVTSPNLPFAATPLRERLSAAVGLPVMVENDALAAALGEARFGAGCGASDIVMITIGTGIGGGIIIDGRPYRGFAGGAGEIGHMVVDPDGPLCACGRRGCLEAVAAGPAIAAQARDAVERDRNSQIYDLVCGDITAITGATVGRAAAAGDATAARVLREAGEWLGLGAANAANLLNPELIILGGGVMTGDTVIIETVRRVVGATALAPNRDAEVVAAALGDTAGLLGAVSLLFL